MTILFYIAIFIFLLLSVLLSLVILVQESKSLGLGASFGGDAGDSLFGTSTAQVLKKFTAYLAIFFMVSCVLLSIWSGSMGKSSSKAAFPIEQTSEPVAKLHDSGKSMILEAIARPGKTWPGRFDGDLPRRVGEEKRSQKLPKGRFYASKSFATGSLE